MTSALSALVARLAAMDDMRARAQGTEAVSLLWQVCQIPDFRKLLEESHVRLLQEIFEQLRPSMTKGRTLVVVGVGHIGSEICQIGQALGMRVFGVDLAGEQLARQVLVDHGFDTDEGELTVAAAMRDLQDDADLDEAMRTCLR